MELPPFNGACPSVHSSTKKENDLTLCVLECFHVVAVADSIICHTRAAAINAHTQPAVGKPNHSP